MATSLRAIFSSDCQLHVRGYCDFNRHSIIIICYSNVLNSYRKKYVNILNCFGLFASHCQSFAPSSPSPCPTRPATFVHIHCPQDFIASEVILAEWRRGDRGENYIIPDRAQRCFITECRSPWFSVS